MGHVKGNKMIDMKLANNKLIDRGARMVSEELNLQYDEAKKLLLESGNVRKALDNKDNIKP
jgi:N-acetylmuramic acid 6-phosphate etherase